MKFFFALESWARHAAAQWWLVITRPSRETNDAEQPPAMRAEARIT